MRFVKHLIPSPPLFAAIAAFIIMSMALLVPPIVGMADNGDFYRITNGNGLYGIYKIDRGEEDEYFDYFSSKFGVYQYFNEYEASLLSSQTFVIAAAKGIDSLLTTDKEVFDIRFLGGILILYCTIAIYMLVDYLTYRQKGFARYLVSAIAIFIFADTGYTAYFNSFYAEGLVMASFLAATGCILLLMQKRYSPYLLLGGFFFNSLILIFAKQQNAPLGILFALLLVLLVRIMTKEHFFDVPSDEGEKCTRPYIAKRSVFMSMAVSAAVLMAGGGIAVYLLIPQEFVNINEYHAMTRGVLMTSTNPEETLGELDISSQYALLNKSIYYERYPAVDVDSEELESSFYNKYDFVSIATYYLEHPDKLYQMLDLSAKSAYSIRPASLGNFEKSAGRQPGAKTQFFTLYSTLKEAYVPRTIGFILIYLAMIVGLSFKNKGRTMILVFALMAGLLQIIVSIVGAGDADIAKHVFLYNVSFDFILYMGLSAMVIMMGKKSQAKRAAKLAKRKSNGSVPPKIAAGVPQP